MEASEEVIRGLSYGPTTPLLSISRRTPRQHITDTYPSMFTAALFTFVTSTTEEVIEKYSVLFSVKRKNKIMMK